VKQVDLDFKVIVFVMVFVLPFVRSLPSIVSVSASSFQNFGKLVLNLLSERKR